LNKLSNLRGYSSGELECAIDRELKPLCMCIYYPDLNNNISGPLRPLDRPLPIALELPPRRSYGRIDSLDNSIWLFRYDTSYTIICTAPVLQRKLDALAVLSDDDIVFSTPQKDGSGLVMLKFSNHDSLTLAVTVLRHTLYALQAASDNGEVWRI
jgi:hypothetical protein